MANRTIASLLLAVGMAAGGPLVRSEDRPKVLVPMAIAVRDAHGRPISDLAAADLEIVEAGMVRTIGSLAFRGASPRRLAIYFDEYHIGAGAPTERARAALLAFLDRHHRAGDTLFVMKPLDPQDAHRPITIERARQAVRAFTGRKQQYAPQGPFEAEYMSSSPQTADRQRAQVVRAGIQSLATALREPLDTAKALVVVTEGFPSGDQSRWRVATLRSIARVSRLANVPVYVLDPSVEPKERSPFTDAWRALADQTGGGLVPAGADLDEGLDRVATDLEARYLVEFEPAVPDDGGFHDLAVQVKRKGAAIRAPTGYWSAFPPSRFPAPVDRPRPTLLTPHYSGLIHPWFRMAPGTDGRTRVTFSWRSKAGRPAHHLQFAAISFEGEPLHAAALGALGAERSAAAETTFEVLPGPLQISMAVHDANQRLLDTDVRYLDVPALDGPRAVITAIEFVRPRSLPEFNAMARDPNAMPTEVRDFVRQDRLIVRVRAFAGLAAADVRIRLMNRGGDFLMELPRLAPSRGTPQFELPWARWPRGEYRLEVRAGFGSSAITQLVTVRLIG